MTPRCQPAVTEPLAAVDWMDERIRQLEQDGSLFEHLCRFTHDGIALLDRDFDFVYANEAFAGACGLSVGELLGRNHFDLFPSALLEDFEQVVETGAAFCACAAPFLFRDGRERSEHDWEVSLVPLRGRGNGDVELLLYVLKDVSEERRAAFALNKTSRALRALVACNSLMIHATGEAELLAGICRLAVEVGGYLMAWIGVPEDDPDATVRPVAQSGFEEGYLDSIRVSWHDTDLGRGPTGTAIRTKTTQVNQNCLTNPRMAPWREAALARGYQSSIALPLVSGDAVLGALTIYGVEPDAFGPEEVSLLEQLAADISFAVASRREGVARLDAEMRVHRSEERYQQLFHEGTDAIAVADAETGVVLDVNRAMERLVGWKKAELVGRSQKILHPPEPGSGLVSSSFARHRSSEDAIPIETQIVTKSGAIREVEVKASQLKLHGRNTLMGFFRDITERKTYEARLEHQATHDALTGLPNRHLLNDRFAMAIALSRRMGCNVAAMLIDLDRFKLVNDSLGHTAGDKLLAEIATRLAGCMRAGDTVARLGGDEFMVIMTDVASEEDAAAFARRLMAVAARPVAVDQREVMVSASVGICVCPKDGDSPAALFRNADIAMYRAKETGRNRFQFYSPEMNARMLERLELETEMRHAVEREELALEYQPRVRLDDGRIVGAEALLRWNHPVRGRIAPADFIPLAEETGLILGMGEWVIRQACAQMRAWNEQGLPRIRVAVNLSAVQFQHEGLAGLVGRTIAESGVAAGTLEVEVTESVAMADPEETIALLRELKGLGVGISLDDFGTGYSSLSRLKRFPLDNLKIDRSFVHSVTSDADDAAIARLVISLAHGLKKNVVAEGVETREQLQFLRREGCDEMQGYLFSRPVPPEEFARLLREGRRLEPLRETR